MQYNKEMKMNHGQGTSAMLGTYRDQTSKSPMPSTAHGNTQNELRESLEELHKNLAAMRERLEMVCVPAPPVGNDRALADTPMCSPAVAQLRMNIGIVRDCSAILGDLNARMEI